MTDTPKTKTLATVLRLKPDGTVTKEFMLGRRMMTEFWRQRETYVAHSAGLQTLFADAGVTHPEKPCRICYRGHWEEQYSLQNSPMPVASLEPVYSRPGSTLVAGLCSSSNFFHPYSDLVYGDVLVRLPGSVSRRCMLAGRGTNDLQDAIDFIDQSNMGHDFQVLYDRDVWVIQISRNDANMRKMMLFSKMRFG
jgi:hypothetical protein